MWVGVVDESQTRELRRRVLRPNLTPADPLPGDEVQDAVHIGAIGDDATAACACIIYPDPCPWLPDRVAWHLRQMATAETSRGRGLGRLVIEAAVQHVDDAGGTVIWCNARESAVGFYRRAGFLVHGDPYLDGPTRIPHLLMWRELSWRPTSSEEPRRTAGA